MMSREKIVIFLMGVIVGLSGLSGIVVLAIGMVAGWYLTKEGNSDLEFVKRYWERFRDASSKEVKR